MLLALFGGLVLAVAVLSAILFAAHAATCLAAKRAALDATFEASI